MRDLTHIQPQPGRQRILYSKQEAQEKKVDRTIRLFSSCRYYMNQTILHDHFQITTWRPHGFFSRENMPKMFMMGFPPATLHPPWLTPDQITEDGLSSLTLLWLSKTRYSLYKDHLASGKKISTKSFFSPLTNLLIYLFLAALGLRCCAWAFSGCGERGLLFVAVCRLLIAVASLAVEHGL